MLKIQNSHLTETQVETILQQNPESEILSDLEELYIGNNNLSDILLNPSVSNLRVLHCDNANLDWFQIKEILQGIKDSKALKLEELNISMNNMKDINPLLLSESLHRLKSVNLSGCDADLSNFIPRLAFGDSNIQILNISYHNLSAVYPIVISLALNKCVSVDVTKCRLLDNHLESIAEGIRKGRLGCQKQQSKLKHLKISKYLHYSFKQVLRRGLGSCSVYKARIVPYWLTIH